MFLEKGRKVWCMFVALVLLVLMENESDQRCEGVKLDVRDMNSLKLNVSVDCVLRDKNSDFGIQNLEMSLIEIAIFLGLDGRWYV